MLKPDLPLIMDAEGDGPPAGLPPVVDAHVHIFPRTLFAAIHQWFDAHAWPIRYRMNTDAVLDFLFDRGVAHLVALQYAHKPGIAVSLNQYMAAKCARFGKRVIGMATIYPGERNARAILEAAFDAGLAGVKLHAHVQCFDMNDAQMAPVYEVCAERAKPIIMHVGREPNSPQYACDPHLICRADKLERVVREHPRLRVCVPHLGMDELTAYRHLIEKYDNLWLDTTMALSEYLPLQEGIDLASYRWQRVMYGSDFPNIPYAWDRELKHLARMNLSAQALEWVLHRSAADFFQTAFQPNLPSS
ncbi:amidohydrolase family protein [Desulfatitalea alkaliphila]|uniref:Amidohydrolase n=1 Tax=Desulfatitalea alkaliphila TaxID=2929485 RepID=A0AA41R8N1_9BACT|nr:amidohydrolase family protein [Desulfatitalea alkaliphila]MCJ8500903.1 amidohydrolase [Desulfatitalea alkaliphila]